jgi:anthranilate synthase component 1
MNSGQYTPSLEQVKKLAGKGNITPIYREIFADLETPVSAYLKVCRDEPYSFLLESVEGGEHLARYSFMGCDPYLTLRLDKGVAYARQNGYKQTINYDDPLQVIASYLKSYELVELPELARELPRFYGGAVGYLTYETARYFEKLPVPENEGLGMPEGIFVFADTVLVFDHLKRRIKIVSHVHLDGNEDEITRSYAEAVSRIEKQVARLEEPIPLDLIKGVVEGYSDGPVSSNVTREDFIARVEKAKEYIRAGDIIQVVPSQRLSRPTSARPINIYRSLRAVNPSPYMYYLNFPEFDIIGASPELLVQVENGTISTHPIAGTVRRGANEAEDRELARELAADEKERAEHVMLVDLGRNDIGRVSVPGTVRVTQLMDVERYSHVMHLVSHVVGQLRPDMTPYEALRACFPAGTVSGAPKIRAMEIIAELETDKRGLYAGAVGYFSFSGNLDTAIAIRTIVYKDGMAHVQAGGGVVADSDPEKEYQETLNKAYGMLKALDEAERFA